MFPVLTEEAHPHRPPPQFPDIDTQLKEAIQFNFSLLREVRLLISELLHFREMQQPQEAIHPIQFPPPGIQVGEPRPVPTPIQPVPDPSSTIPFALSAVDDHPLAISREEFKNEDQVVDAPETVVSQRNTQVPVEKGSAPIPFQFSVDKPLAVDRKKLKNDSSSVPFKFSAVDNEPIATDRKQIETTDQEAVSEDVGKEFFAVDAIPEFMTKQDKEREPVQ